ncbi:MAG: hypothetical protein HC919_06765 [Oscillatoriales cyanobacterium SM2_2_1]|nr:hypothetical protein [Oscillatoriales cyanobacterium SM2_2_1]
MKRHWHTLGIMGLVGGVTLGMATGFSMPAIAQDGSPPNLETKPASGGQSQIQILSPSPETALDVPAATVVLRLPVGMTAELQANGTKVDPNSIGRVDSDAAAKTITQTWFGVPLQRGDNTLTATLVDGSGRAVETVTLTLRVRGAIAGLQVGTLETRIPADGRSTATVQGILLDERGDRANQNAIITLTASEGEFIGTDARPEQPGFQVEAREGRYAAQLRSGLNSGAVRIRATAIVDNRSLEAFTQLQLETNLRTSLATGVIDFRIGPRGTDYYRSFRDFLPLDRNNATTVDFYAAAFTTGRMGEWLFTGAINTRRSLNEDCEGRTRLFRDVQFCDQNYPVYGDSSTVTAEAPSLSSVFLRLERTSPVPNAGTDYVMWGDFRTTEFASRSQEFTALNRQLNGFKLNYNWGDVQITGFYSNTTRSFQRDLIPPDGTSGFYFLSRRLVVPGSENVFLEWEEQLRPGNVVRRVALNRSQDYEIDYDRGSLQFRLPILQTDIGPAGEVLIRRIVVTYETESQSGEAGNIYAGQLRYHFSRIANQESWLGVNYFQENQGVRQFQLYGANALVSLGQNSFILGEYARSENSAPELTGTVTGSAARIEAQGELSTGVIAKAFYRTADTGFINNASISFVPGQTRYGASLDAKVSPTTTLRATVEREENRGVAPQAFTLNNFLNPTPQPAPGTPVDNDFTFFSVGVLQKLGTVSLELDWLFRDRQDRLSQELAGSSSQLRSRLTVPIADNLSIIAQNETSVSSGQDAVLPDRTALVVDWRIVEGVNLRVGQQWFASGALAGSSFTIAEISSDYALTPDTTLKARYGITGGANATTTQGAIGLNHKWAISPGLRLNVGYERIFGSNEVRTAAGTQVLQPLTTGVNPSTLSLQSGDNFNLGLEYTESQEFQASARYEYRTSAAGGNSVLTLGGLGKLSPSLTGLLRYQQSGVANQTINNFGDTANFRLGLAYRDPNDDQWNALLRYEYRRNPGLIPDSVIGGIGSSNEEHLFGIEAIYAPSWQWEFYGKYVFRNATSYLAQDLVGTSSVNLTQLRATYRLGYEFDLTGEVRFINQPTAGFSELGWVAELGYYLSPNLRLAVGYSSGSVNADRDFSGTRSAGGLYAGVTLKLDELFGNFGLQNIPPRRQQEPVDPSTPIELPVRAGTGRSPIATTAPVAPELLRVSLAQPVVFPGQQSELSGTGRVVLDNLVTVLREYPALSVDVQGALASLQEMSSPTTPEARRLSNVRSYLIGQGIDGGRVTLRSLGIPSQVEQPANLQLALAGVRPVFDQISQRLQQSGAPAALQSLLPAAGLQATLPGASPPSSTTSAIAQVLEFAPQGTLRDASIAALDQLLGTISNDPNVAIELSGTLEGSPAEVNRLITLRSYLIKKGISGDRIIFSGTNISQETPQNSVALTLARLDSVDAPIARQPAPPESQPDIRLSTLFPDQLPPTALPESYQVSTTLPPLVPTLLVSDRTRQLLSQLLTDEPAIPVAVLPDFSGDRPLLSFSPSAPDLIGLLLDPNLDQQSPSQRLRITWDLTRLPSLAPPPLPSMPIWRTSPIGKSPAPLRLGLNWRDGNLLTLAPDAPSPRWANITGWLFDTPSVPRPPIALLPTRQFLSLNWEPSRLISLDPAPATLSLTPIPVVISQTQPPNRPLVSALQFLFSRDRDALAALMRSLSQTQPELLGEVIDVKGEIGP